MKSEGWQTIKKRPVEGRFFKIAKQGLVEGARAAAESVQQGECIAGILSIAFLGILNFQYFIILAGDRASAGIILLARRERKQERACYEGKNCLLHGVCVLGIKN